MNEHVGVDANVPVVVLTELVNLLLLAHNWPLRKLSLCDNPEIGLEPIGVPLEVRKGNSAHLRLITGRRYHIDTFPKRHIS
jgi:hypothetical protein